MSVVGTIAQHKDLYGKKNDYYLPRLTKKGFLSFRFSRVVPEPIYAPYINIVIDNQFTLSACP